MQQDTSTWCLECDETITEPVCPLCLTHRMRTFVEERRPDLAQHLVSPVEEGGEIGCIICGKSMNVCAHCVSSDVYTYLIGEDPSLAEEFMGRFDFDLRKTFL